MPVVTVPTTGIDIDYAQLGDPAGSPLLLIHGLSRQHIEWPPLFVDAFVNAGFRVIVFDNRDTGRSSHTRMDATTPAYTLVEMAADAAGLLDMLELSRVHVLGLSMGGMIAQQFAIDHPTRIRSLVSIMSTPDLTVGQATPEAQAVLSSPPVRSRSEAQERALAINAVLGSPGFPRDEALILEIAGAAWDRAHDPMSVPRQLSAVMSSRDRRPGLANVFVPTLVIHGADDPLVTVDGGKETAAAIPDASLLVIPGMGHDLPPGVIPIVTEAAIAHLKSASPGN